MYDLLNCQEVCFHIFITNPVTVKKILWHQLLSGKIRFRGSATHRQHAERVDWVSMLEVEE